MFYKPLGKVSLKEGERIRVTIKKKARVRTHPVKEETCVRTHPHSP